jgi:hypothetical protein
MTYENITVTKAAPVFVSIVHLCMREKKSIYMCQLPRRKRFIDAKACIAVNVATDKLVTVLMQRPAWSKENETGI